MQGLGEGRLGLVVVLALLASGPAETGHYRRSAVPVPVVLVSVVPVPVVPVPVVSGLSRTETAADDAVRKQLAGEWTLVNYEVFPENGPSRPGNYDIGRINYGEREMSAHLMRSGRPKESAATEAARAAAFQGYLGYFGPIRSTPRSRSWSTTSPDRRCPIGSAASRYATTASPPTASS